MSILADLLEHHSTSSFLVVRLAKSLCEGTSLSTSEKTVLENYWNVRNLEPGGKTLSLQIIDQKWILTGH